MMTNKELADLIFPNITKTPEEYIKEYPIETCMILDHRGNEEKKYYDVPRINLKDFLLKENDNKKDPDGPQ